MMTKAFNPVILIFLFLMTLSDGKTSSQLCPFCFCQFSDIMYWCIGIQIKVKNIGENLEFDPFKLICEHYYTGSYKISNIPYLKTLPEEEDGGKKVGMIEIYIFSLYINNYYF